MQRPRGRIKESPEDFVVEELPAYEPSGQGDHLYLRFTKRNLTTTDAVARIGRALGVHPRDVGVAGMKDKVAVTTQTVSVPLPPRDQAGTIARAEALAIDGITIRGVSRHTNKLKTGHLAGNRFEVVVRGVDPEREAEVVTAIEAVGRDGLPNAFGPQRFGRDGDNADRARAWLSGRTPAPRDGRLARLLFSSLQADLYNRVLAARLSDGTWNRPLPGDLVKRHRGPALFLWSEAEPEPPSEVSPTGPMFGVKMREPEGAPLALERRVLHEALGEGVDLSGTRRLGEGTRRSLRLWVDELRVERLAPPEGGAGGLKFYFVLPKGGYATSVLAMALELDQGAPDPAAQDAGEVSHLPGSEDTR